MATLHISILHSQRFRLLSHTHTYKHNSFISAPTHTNLRLYIVATLPVAALLRDACEMGWIHYVMQ